MKSPSKAVVRERGKHEVMFVIYEACRINLSISVPTVIDILWVVGHVMRVT